MPDKKIFIDGRMPQVAYKNHTILEEYFEFFDKDTLIDKLNEYDIKLVLINNNKNDSEATWFEKKILKLDYKEKNNDLYNYLQADKTWKKVFYNDASIIYIR
jgi:hypothetical protein